MHYIVKSNRICDDCEKGGMQKLISFEVSVLEGVSPLEEERVKVLFSIPRAVYEIAEKYLMYVSHGASADDFLASLNPFPKWIGRDAFVSGLRGEVDFEIERRQPCP
jgi:hypothetical protein